MIRPLTLITFLLACGSGLYLYQAKHRVKVLDDQIAQVIRSTDAMREQTRMLSAEWTLLNDPERLRRLANQLLPLQTVAPTQFTSLANLDSRLPAPVAPAALTSAQPSATSSPAADTPAPDGSLTDKPAGARSVGAKATETDGSAAKPAAGQPTPNPAAAPAEPGHMSDHHASPSPVSPRVAAADPLPSHRTAPHTDADRRTVDQRSAEQRPAEPDRHAADQRDEAGRARPWTDDRPPQRPPVVAAQAPVPVGGGSLLGMAHSMAAPPVPVPIPRPMPVAAPGPYYGSTGG